MNSSNTNINSSFILDDDLSYEKLETKEELLSMSLPHMERWKKLIDSGIFDKSFALRVNASFQYLDSKNVGSFNVRDLFERGEFVFKYLGTIPIKHETSEDNNNKPEKKKKLQDNDNDDVLKKEDLETIEENENKNEIENNGNFSIIDIFRQYDINGGGTCCLVEFVVGNIEHLLVLYESEVILSSILNEIIPGDVDRRNLNEIISLLSNEPIQKNQSQLNIDNSDIIQPISIAKSNDNEFIKYKTHFNALNYLLLEELIIFKSNLEKKSYGEDDIYLNKNELKSLLFNSIEKSIAELQSQFHISSQILNALIKENSLGSKDSYIRSKILDNLLDRFDSAPIAWKIIPKLDISELPCILGDMFKPLEDDNNTYKRGNNPLLTKSLLNINIDDDHDDDEIFDETGNVSNKLLLSQGVNFKDFENFDFGRLDSDQIFLLQTALSSINNFFTVVKNNEEYMNNDVDKFQFNINPSYDFTNVDDEENQNIYEISPIKCLDFNSEEKIENEIHINKNINTMINELIENDKTKNDNINIMLSNKLFESQEELRRTKLRLQVMDLMILMTEDDGNEEMNHIIPTEFNLIDNPNFGFIESIINGNKNINEVMSNLNNSIKTASEHEELDLPIITYESIFEEIVGLKTCIANRCSKKLALGTLLDNTSILIPIQSDLKQINNDNKSHNILQMLEDLQLSSDLIETSLTSKAYEEEQHLKYKQIISNQEEKIKELNLLKQHVTQERNDFIVCSIEVQVLREKIQRSQTEIKTLLNTNSDLVNKWKDAELKLQQANQNLNLINGGNNNPMKISQSNNNNNDSNNNSKSNILKKFQGIVNNAMNESVSDEYKHDILITELEEKIDVITSEKNSLQKENKRLTGLLKTAENRMKGTLQDQMLLSQHLHLAQDEQSGSKTFIAQLLQDLEYERSSKDTVEELQRQINDLQHEFDKAQSELREARADRKLLVNLKLDLQHAENQVEALENNLSEGTIELERGAIAIEQLDNYREQLREKTKENREMRLRLQCLDKELNDNSYIKTQYKQSEEELREYKIKLEKVPNLITEIARLRGSSKASVKALSEQDAFLSQFKLRIKTLEKENNRLQADNRSMQDIETKLLEANLEIKKLVEMNNISNSSMNNGNNKPNIVKLNEHNRGAHISATPPPANFKVPASNLSNTSNADSPKYSSPKSSDFLSTKENKDGSNNITENNSNNINTTIITPVVNNHTTITKQVEKNEHILPKKELAVNAVLIQKTTVDDSEKIDKGNMMTAKDKIAAMFALKGPQKPQ